jgi:hypothetical protein
MCYLYSMYINLQTWPQAAVWRPMEYTSLQFVCHVW